MFVGWALNAGIRRFPSITVHQWKSEPKDQSARLAKVGRGKTSLKVSGSVVSQIRGYRNAAQLSILG